MSGSPKSDASHESIADDATTVSGTIKAPAVKNKECPYCHQPFTSSSLGRHLDQYLSKRKADGIHNLEEIRRTRGRITRRIPKQGASAGQDREDSHTNNKSPSIAYSTPPVDVDLLNSIPANGVGTRLNEANWHSTGVMNDLPATTPLSSAPSALMPASTKRSWDTYDTARGDSLGATGDLESEKDTARALELALREVLDRLQAARQEIPFLALYLQC